MNFLVKPMTLFFNGIHGFVTTYVSNLSLAYFLDLVIFTAIIKTILLPLTISQTKSSIMIQKMQPKLKEIQEKYKNDPQKMQEEQMKLYKESGTNPLSGCLLFLIQWPIIIAMYYVVANIQGFKDVGFLWVESLGSYDRTFILPILSGLSSYLMGVMTAPKGDDPSAQQQRKMNLYMSILFVVMFFKFQAGVVLYWIISNVIQILQQYFIINRIRHKEEAKLQ
ncbi:membrane protein insertase YidC [Caloramator australicus]|uniref:Inner membrane protein translocase component YidC, short form OxaI-like n=2 Tax=Caloramator TaxID=44258 RepID=I7LHI9_9CLOT|nr:membrane protein insertase YidC [Caloramator australicus]CCJ34071.1 Inner membrane protein translocase component YidC, short form OxaI-like [Caloramator australicus RC3]